MARVGLAVMDVQPNSGTIIISLNLATSTNRTAGLSVEMNATDTIVILNTNIRAAAKAFLEANYPGDANWNLAEYVLFGGGQIIL